MAARWASRRALRASSITFKRGPVQYPVLPDGVTTACRPSPGVALKMSSSVAKRSGPSSVCWMASLTPTGISGLCNAARSRLPPSACLESSR